MRRNAGATILETRKRLAAKAYGRTAAYDAAISQWFARALNAPLPDYFVIGGRRLQVLRYGENPHQSAALYETPEGRAGVATARQLQKLRQLMLVQMQLQANFIQQQVDKDAAQAAAWRNFATKKPSITSGKRY